MSREFDLGGLAAHFAAVAANSQAGMEAGLKQVAKSVERTAKDKFGVYQKESGPFQDWAELSESTKDDRLKHGYTENDPLFRSGHLRDTVEHEVNQAGLEAVVGSKDDIMAWQEFGTHTIPPRPVIGPAAFENKEFILSTLGKASVTGMVDGDPIHESLGYDFET